MFWSFWGCVAILRGCVRPLAAFLGVPPYGCLCGFWVLGNRCFACGRGFRRVVRYTVGMFDDEPYLSPRGCLTLLVSLVVTVVVIGGGILLYSWLFPGDRAPDDSQCASNNTGQVGYCLDDK